jgi:hypothetical protein
MTQRIKRLSTTIESEVELARLWLDSKKYKEVICHGGKTPDRLRDHLA